MSPRAFVCSLVAVAALIPGLARAGSSTTISATSPVAAGAQGSVLCSFQCTAGGMSFCSTTVDRFIFTSAPGGTFPQGGATETVMVSPSTTAASASVTWTAPASEGQATLTCKGANASGVVTSIATATVNVTAPAPAAPVISDLSAPASTFVGSSSVLAVVATDPSGPITYAWSATGGSFETASTGPSATWIAPAAAGNYVVTVTATNGAGAAAQRSVVVNVVLSVYQSSLAGKMRGPRRVAATAEGDLFVTDGNFRFSMLTRLGALRTYVALPAGASAVAVAGGTAYVGTDAGAIFMVDVASGRVVGQIPYRYARGPDGIAVDGSRGWLWAANYDAGSAVALRPDGSQALVVSAVSGRRLLAVADVAYDAERDEIWVAERAYESGPMVHALRAADGVHLRSFVLRGGGAGQVMSVGGIAVAGGRLFVSDAYSGTVQVLAALDGALLGAVGQKGIAPGDLNQPRGLALLPNGDLAVANEALSRIDRFGNGAPLPTCAGDTDCDGLLDDRELAEGLNIDDPTDAFADADTDGLSNQDEVAHGTDLRGADTDGDGFSDGAEVARGFDPLDPGDHRATLTASASSGGPGFVRLHGSVGGLAAPVACSVGWRQLGGPIVALRDAESLTSSFVARRAGTYRFAADAVCEGVPAVGAVAEVVIDNVAPIADAGRVLVVDDGARVALSARGSTDANGDPIAFSWEQTAGTALSGPVSGAALKARFADPGTFTFTLTAADAANASSSAEATVVVLGTSPVPVAAVAGPAAAAVGQEVKLDASASLAGPGARFAWEQLAGEPVTLQDAGVGLSSFVAPTAGRYAFQVSVLQGQVRSPPARIDVYVVAAGVEPPYAVASAPSVVAVNSPLTLDGSGSTASGATVYSWRQVSGPAAGLRDADRAKAEVVCFEPGSYVFELALSEGGAPAVPARVRVEARADGRPIPVARVEVPSEAYVGQKVGLDGRGSTSAKGFRWTQVSGPWVVVNGGSQASFIPALPGRYGFELEVDDGSVRSAPVDVTIDVR